jgi:hypothetical protein
VSVAFEYQGEMHYKSSFTFGLASERQQRDRVKMDFAKRMGITLIPIPFWWDRSAGSLAATILNYRLDLIDPTLAGSVIPSTMPVITTPTKPEFILNAAQLYDDKIDPTGWY